MRHALRLALGPPKLIARRQKAGCGNFRRAERRRERNMGGTAFLLPSPEQWGKKRRRAHGLEA